MFIKRFLSLHKTGFKTTHLCEILNVSRNAYYAWVTSEKSIYQQQDQRVQPLVQDVFYQHRRRYGARRIAKELTAMGESCSRAKVRKIMGQMDLTAIQPRSFKPRTTESQHKLGYSPNLLLEGIETTRIVTL